MLKWRLLVPFSLAALNFFSFPKEGKKNYLNIASY